ncbi:hypothetical protein BACEGG_00669 [Bacteroides eggerthii DSM 20697]|nr:hypothetical protein BACEGG_00669 [Bacteroides eggerthii DSM 20697]
MRKGKRFVFQEELFPRMIQKIPIKYTSGLFPLNRKFISIKPEVY